MHNTTVMESLGGLGFKIGMTDYDCCGGEQHPETRFSGTRSSSSGSSGSRRKHHRWDQSESSTRSLGSLLTTMEKFVQTVDDMNETILVPCRLMDVKFDSSTVTTTQNSSLNSNATTISTPFQAHAHLLDPKIRLMRNLNGVDLFQFYTILNSVKSDLMWGNKSSQVGGVNSAVSLPSTINGIMTSSSNLSVASSTVSSTSSGNSSAASSVGSNPNGESVSVKGHVRRPSTVSTASSETTSDTEFSDLNEDSGLEGEEDYSQHLADSFHHHLTGLQQCLRDLTLAADYVTNRYNNDLGAV